MTSLRRPLPVLVLALLASTGARAAVDDINAADQPFFADARPVIAAAQRLVETAVESGQAVVAAVQKTFEPSAPPTRLGTAATPRRATDLIARADAVAEADAAASALATADPVLGANWRVLHGDADTHVPTVAWMTDVPGAGGGGALLSSTALRPSVHLSAEWALPGDVTLGVMPGMAVDLDDVGRRTASGTLALTVGKAWSPQWQTFVDMARDRLALSAPGIASRTVDAGVRFVASSTTQVDVALTRGLSAAAPAFQAGVGVSSKF